MNGLFGKVWKNLKSLFKWLFIIVLLVLLIQWLLGFMEHYDLLIKKVTEQGLTIDQLQNQTEMLKEANGHLSQQLSLEHMKVEQLQQELKVSINGQPVIMTPEDVEEEVKPQLKLPETSYTVPIVVISALQILKSLVLRVPAF